ncbi:MAG TPA: phosphoribosylglycinamide formyltransferase [Gammaproteobacteria bacterium]|jgi:phosphoribosylglycinamide formyltransferase-1
MDRPSAALPVVVLVSGHGSNLQAILDKARALSVEVCAVISDKPQARALEQAHAAGVPTSVITATEYPDRDSYDRALMQAIDRRGEPLVILAGFMRILGRDFVHRYAGRLLNIHPSLLPRHRGLHTHRRALEAGDTQHGCSVHFVTLELDAGQVIAQAPVPVKKDDDEAALRVRVQAREHVIYPEVIGWFAAGRLRLENERVMFDGAPLGVPKIFPWQE